MNGCIEFRGHKRKDGYGALTIRRRYWLAHRFAYECVKGPIPPGMCVCHACDNPSCVNPEHLWLGTNADNVADKVVKGRQLRGEKAALAKLTEAKVRTIRAEYAAGVAGYKKLARKYGVNRTTIRPIVRRKTWRHVR
ncbi:MAG TPA: HNH endonuclease [Casimicrobiaceae bacterium]